MYADRDKRISSRPAMGWEDAHTARQRRAVKKATRHARRARERQMRARWLRGDIA